MGSPLRKGEILSLEQSRERFVEMANFCQHLVGQAEVQGERFQKMSKAQVEKEV